jgi:hypothetical protein
MATTTSLFAVILLLLGIGSYLLTGRVSATALIPAYFGAVLGLLGNLARRDHLRKHAMHAAAMVGLLGMAGALYSLFRAPLGSRSVIAEGSQALMAGLMAAFLVLCVRSFIAARRARG